MHWSYYSNSSALQWSYCPLAPSHGSVGWTNHHWRYIGHVWVITSHRICVDVITYPDNIKSHSIISWMNSWTNSWVAGDLRCHGTNCDITVKSTRWVTEKERLLGWLPWSSLETLRTSFNITSDGWVATLTTFPFLWSTNDDQDFYGSCRWSGANMTILLLFQCL